ncbi:hypothetical protein L596_005062 [Steinernema carpocapsae]|uniref:Uncharacterized protein n=1 Tax=Steinernema carpocapsae TaxID=34508 RepID=A0A4U8UYU8_STECR|nr:hypothetical protein L596_005062 [Steinernema carpocapsae]
MDDKHQLEFFQLQQKFIKSGNRDQFVKELRDHLESINYMKGMQEHLKNTVEKLGIQHITIENVVGSYIDDVLKHTPDKFMDEWGSVIEKMAVEHYKNGPLLR